MTREPLRILLDELDAWEKEGLTAEFWWRDDDAAEPHVALDRLFALSDRHETPCGLAVIPARAGEPLRKAVSQAHHIWVLQHGYAHKNHAPKGGGAWELGMHRPVSVIREELSQGTHKLNQLFKDRFVPVIVPPWNRIDPELLAYLPVMGFRGVSASYKKDRPEVPEGLRRADAHCDLLNWKDKAHGARFAGSDKCLAGLIGHLRDKRTGEADPSEPTCVLSHHLEMDEAAWDFLETTLSAIREHPAAAWVSPVQIWPAN
ncbi:hypothetical protein GM415_04950 [Pseudodesulfovibrio cashew]|uniref:Polysaccharide deacetylase n=2 Tax=Pseudodesulfovibrio cashew TaxID=2678688 RepID=A0A6I6JLU8_9BACT|nr:hypothetical protein GM415_04950 [Pseudodesulfovibrio cashew]